MVRSRIPLPWLIVVLVGGYISFQLIADVAAVKLVQIGPLIIPAGTLMFSITFTWRDMIHRGLGKQWAQASIGVAAIANVMMALYFTLTINLPHPTIWNGQEALITILGMIPRITIASIIAEVVSELVDTEIYQRLQNRPRWQAVLGSNAISLPLDSFIFVLLAFVGTMPTDIVADIVLDQTIFKLLVTVASIPLIYLLRLQPISWSFAEGS